MEKPKVTTRKETRDDNADPNVNVGTGQDMGAAQDDGAPEDEQATGLGGVLTLKRFFPRAWIIANIVPEGIGYKIGVVHVTGMASGYSIKTGQLASDLKKESVCLTGAFSMSNMLTGEFVEGHTIYLPDNASRRIAGAIDIAKSEGSDEVRVMVDLEIGIHNIDGSIPYEWLAYSFIQDKGSLFLAKMRKARETRRPAIAVSHMPQRLLTAG